MFNDNIYIITKAISLITQEIRIIIPGCLIRLVHSYHKNIALQITAVIFVYKTFALSIVMDTRITTKHCIT